MVGSKASLEQGHGPQQGGGLWPWPMVLTATEVHAASQTILMNVTRGGCTPGRVVPVREGGRGEGGPF